MNDEFQERHSDEQAIKLELHLKTPTNYLTINNVVERFSIDMVSLKSE